MQRGEIPRDARIVVVGAGAAGLCVAWYLKQAGFHRVQVLEKSARLGGKCRSLTVGGQSFDLGANYITSAYKRVRALAAHVGAGMYTEKAGHVIDVQTGQMRSILSQVLRHTSIFTLGWQSLRYAIKRWRLRRLLSPVAPGFAHVQAHPELHGNFEDWLNRHRLGALIPIFEIPLTLMGYGKLRDIATVYALTYMSLGSFMDLAMFAANFPLRSWPKRFNQGYGRMFERLAAEVDVLTGVDIQTIIRPDDRTEGQHGADDTITVRYRLREQQLEHQTSEDITRHYDYLILACPQLPALLNKFIKLTDTEQLLFDQVLINPFYVTAYNAPGTERVAAVTFSLPEPELGQPYVVTRQFPENDFISVYTRGDATQQITRAQVEAHNAIFLRKIGAVDPERHDFICDDWAYFPHVSPAAVDEGFYTKLDDLQGEKRTFYCGGLLAFELVETIAEQAHHLVDTHFSGGPKP